MLTSINNTLPGHTAVQTPSVVRSGDNASEATEVRPSDDHVFSDPSFDGRRAVQIFRQEVLLSLRAQSFSINYIPQDKVADTYQSPETVTENLLKITKNLITGQSGGAMDTVLRVKNTIEQAVASTRSLLETSEEAAAVENAARFVTQALDDLEQSESPDVVDVQNSLAVDARRVQRSRIIIRTQEGDLVKLDLRQRDHVSLVRVHAEDGLGSSTYTEIEVSEKSRLRLKIHGDLNPDELTAIRDIFAQAEAIADEFFSGDVIAAFEIAAGLDIDQDQIARVRLRFSETEKIRVVQTQSETVADEPSAQLAALPPTETSGSTNETAAENVDSPPVTTSQTSRTDAQVVPETGSIADLADTDDLLAAAQRIVRNFITSVLRQTTEISSRINGRSNAPDSIRLDISQSFNLKVLQSVISTLAEDDAQPVATQLNDLLDKRMLEDGLERIHQFNPTKASSSIHLV